MKLRNKTVTAVLALVTAAAAGAGIARSTTTEPIPDANGVIHACYKKPIGPARIVYSAANCARGEAPLEWSQAGVPGPQGEPGPQGPPGPAGGGVRAFESATIDARVESESGIVIHSLLLGEPGTYWIRARGTMFEAGTGASSEWTIGECRLLLGATGPLSFTVLDTTGSVNFVDDEISGESHQFVLDDVAEVEQPSRRLEVVCTRLGFDLDLPLDVLDLRISALKVA
jgi:hypothetical protein